MGKILSVLLILTSITVTTEAGCHRADSIEVYFIGEGPKGERIKVQYGSVKILEFKIRGPFKYKFLIPSPRTKKYGAALNVFVLRKGLFGIAFRDTRLNAYYEEGFKYLVIIRDTTLKNRFAVKYEWSNREPYVHHLRDSNE
jgi:hypothetical protein